MAMTLKFSGKTLIEKLEERLKRWHAELEDLRELKARADSMDRQGRLGGAGSAHDIRFLEARIESVSLVVGQLNAEETYELTLEDLGRLGLGQ